ncbi:hypothetical protein M9979_11430 [Sphingomonas sp. RP10(2022)]|uniref:DUF2946 domain-containing protein n=1 Tax=Sphingomonas liriopis TaxID=2949094 RepID=A0A9X2HQA6_9SPHN|nr:DUF2946 family protein [Sphingomonas liriopis]MCP3735481.1 hypothetical protein [Sphingomonas liriopis]
MTSLRRLLLDHRALALWLALAALTVKLLVPAGFMVGTVEGRPVLQLCSGFAPVAAMPMAHHAMAGYMPASHHDKADHAAPEMPCPYAALAQGTLAAVDPLLLGPALAFVLALGFAATIRPPRRAIPYLRPPSHGPPQTT